MKRMLTTLVTALLLAAALAVSAGASEYDSAAQDLAAIGMFRGTAAGFELDRAPTRSEAAIMLVRLHGAEESAKADYAAGKIAHPFTDVSEFASPYVAWVYTNGISKGTSATTFGSGNPCSAKMYSAFLLRALGYEDGVDFAYADTLTFAQAKGFFDTSVFSGTFLRDDLAAMTYQALATDLKDGSSYLLDHLVKSGAIDAKAAAPMTEKMETYRALVASAGAALNSSVDTDIRSDIKMDMSMSGTENGVPVSEKVTQDMTMEGSLQARLDGGNPQMAYDLTMTAEGESMRNEMWLKDGWMYVRSGEGAYKYEVGDMMAAYQQLMDQGMSQMNVGMLPFIDSIKAEKSGSSTVYTMTLNDAMFGMVGGLMDTLLGDLEGMDLSVDLKDCAYTYTVDRNGQLKECAAVMDMTMAMEMEMDAQNRMELAISMQMEMQMDINATGEAVRVSFPDLSVFRELPDELPADTDTAA